MFASEVSAQGTCELLPWDEGGEHYLTIDGDLFMYLPLETSRRLQSEIQECRLKSQELELRERQVEGYERLVELQESTINDLQVEIKFQKDLFNQREPELTLWDRIYNNPRVNLVAGIIIGGAAVGITYHYILE